MSILRLSRRCFLEPHVGLSTRGYAECVFLTFWDLAVAGGVTLAPAPSSPLKQNLEIFQPFEHECLPLGDARPVWRDPKAAKADRGRGRAMCALAI
jgi:hypothetical protein